MISAANDGRYLQCITASITKLPSGTYLVKYRLRDLNGKIIKETSKRGFETQREAKNYVERIKSEHVDVLKKADHPEQYMTFDELCKRYLVSRMGDKPSTILGRESLISSRILPFFKGMDIKSINRDTISRWHSYFYEDGIPVYTETYLRTMHARLSAILNYAVSCGWLDSNPARSCSIGTKNASERPVWSPDEYKRFRKEIEDNPIAYYAFDLLYFTGLRKGELLALTIGDIDFEKKTLKVTKSLQVLRQKEIITTPKTRMSIRSVRLNDMILDELKEYLLTRGNYTEKDRLFPLTKYDLQNSLKKGIAATGLEPITIHCFRHSHITNLIAAGYSPVDIAKRVGHESIYITLHYSHVFKSVDNEIAKCLDRLMEEME